MERVPSQREYQKVESELGALFLSFFLSVSSFFSFVTFSFSLFLFLSHSVDILVQKCLEDRLLRFESDPLLKGPMAPLIPLLVRPSAHSFDSYCWLGGWNPDWDPLRKIVSLRPYKTHIRDRDRQQRSINFFFFFVNCI